MNSEKIRIEVEELQLLVASWKEGEAPSVIEHEVVLAKIAKLYERVKLLTPFSVLEVSSQLGDQAQMQETEETEETEETQEVESEVEAAKTEEPLSYIAEDPLFAIDLEGVSLIEPEATEPVSEVKEEVKEEVEEEVEEEVKEVEPEPAVEPEPEPEPAKVSDMLFDIAPIPKKSRSRRRVLMSLYHDEESQISSRREQPIVVTRSHREEHHTEPFLIDEPAPLQEPKVTPTPTPTPTPTESSAQSAEQQLPQQPQPQQPQSQPQQPSEFISSSATIGDSTTPAPTLADTLARDVETLADRYAETTPQLVGEARGGYNSFDKLGINERYLLARDLFGDDPQLCVEELATIGAFDNYDDAIIYIAENYNWSGESEGAKLLLSVLERKFNIS